MQKDIRTSRHLVLAQIGDDELLTIQFVSALNARGSDRMTLRCVTADDQYEVSFPHVEKGAEITAIPYGAEQSDSCRRLAISGTVVNIVRADHSPGQFLHEIAF